MVDTSLIAISVDVVATTSAATPPSTGGVSHVQDSPSGASRLGFFAWPTLPPALDGPLNGWFRNPSEVPPKALGEQLFSHIFPDGPRETLGDALRAARAEDRILVGISTAEPEMHALPFEILHNGTAYLASGNQIVFRHVNDGVEIPPKTHAFQRFLIILAEPVSPGLPRFNHDTFADETEKSFAGHITPPKILRHASTDDVLKCLKAPGIEPFDAIFIVAHGQPASTANDGYILLEGAGRAPEQLLAGTLADALVTHKGCLVVLCSCSSAAVHERNPLAGVAQRLINSGHAGAVIAMQRPVTIKTGLDFVRSLSGQLREPSIDIFDAFKSATALVTYGKPEHGIPCLYTRLPPRLADGVGLLSRLTRTPDGELLRLQSLLSADQKSTFVFSMGQFREGVPITKASSSVGSGHDPDEKSKAPKSGPYRYPGPTVSIHDIWAIQHFIPLVGRFLARDSLVRRIDIVPDFDVGDLIDRETYTHFILIGSRSHSLSRAKLQDYSEDFKFDFTESNWGLTDKREGIQYKVDAPDKIAKPDTSMKDYAIIEKIIDIRHGRVLFIIAGMWDTSTQAAGRFLTDNWDDIFHKFGSGGFQYILETRQGRPEVERVIRARPPRIKGG
jgi:CHAT domain-containing protein